MVTLIDIIYLYVFPIAAMLFFALFVLFTFVLFPDSARTLLKLRFNKGASLGLIANDDGILHFELLQDKGLGAFQSNRANRRYFFLVRPLFKGESPVNLTKDPKKVEVDGIANTKPNEEVSNAERAIIEENLQKRHVLSDVKKPVYIGYTGKAILTGVSVLNEVTKASNLERTSEAYDGILDVDDIKTLLNAAKSNELAKPKGKRGEVISYVDSYLTVLDPRIWKSYFKRTSNQPTIDALCYTHEQIGAGDKTPLPLGLLLGIAVLIVGGFLALKFLKVI